MDRYIELALSRLERAKLDLNDANILYDNNSFLAANNRAYYSIFHSIRAVLSLENKDFKKHKDILAYFNQYYIKTDIFPRIMGKKIKQANVTREDSDYDDKFVADASNTYNQIEAAKELIDLVEKYLESKT